MLITPSIKKHHLDTNQLRHQLGTNHPFPLCEIFAQHIPLCEFSFVTNFQKHALGLFLKSQCENHRNANLVRIRFCDQFSKPCSLSWRTTGMRNFRTTHHLVRNSHFLFTSRFLLFNSKLVLLQFSQHLFSDHPIPSTRSSPSSFPVLNPTMAAHLHSCGLHYSQQSTPSIFSSFSSFHHQKPFNSSLNTLNPSLNQSQPCFYQTTASS